MATIRTIVRGGQGYRIVIDEYNLTGEIYYVSKKGKKYSTGAHMFDEVENKNETKRTTAKKKAAEVER